MQVKTNVASIARAVGHYGRETQCSLCMQQQYHIMSEYQHRHCDLDLWLQNKWVSRIHHGTFVWWSKQHWFLRHHLEKQTNGRENSAHITAVSLGNQYCNAQTDAEYIDCSFTDTPNVLLHGCRNTKQIYISAYRDCLDTAGGCQEGDPACKTPVPQIPKIHLWQTMSNQGNSKTPSQWNKTDLHHAWRWGHGRENRPSDQVLAGDSRQWHADVPSTDAAAGIHSVTTQWAMCSVSIIGTSIQWCNCSVFNLQMICHGSYAVFPWTWKLVIPTWDIQDSQFLHWTHKGGSQRM